MSTNRRRRVRRGAVQIIELPTDPTKTRDEAWADVVAVIRAAEAGAIGKPEHPRLFPEDTLTSSADTRSAES